MSLLCTEIQTATHFDHVFLRRKFPNFFLVQNKELEGRPGNQIIGRFIGLAKEFRNRRHHSRGRESQWLGGEYLLLDFFAWHILPLPYLTDIWPVLQGKLFVYGTDRLGRPALFMRPGTSSSRCSVFLLPCELHGPTSQQTLMPVTYVFFQFQPWKQRRWITKTTCDVWYTIVSKRKPAGVVETVRPWATHASRPANNT